MNRGAHPPQGIYSVADLARRKGIDPKFARGRLRKHFGGALADLGISDWTYGPEDLDFVLSIIHPGGRPPETSDRHRIESPIHSPSMPAGSTRKAGSVDPYAWPRKPRSELTLPSASGVYALFLREGSALPSISPLDQGLIYIGLGRNLARRCHFSGRTEGHSPRRSLAALLWSRLDLEPRMGANGNYKLTPASEMRLNAWMHENLLMAFEEFGDIETVEDVLIKRLAPPFNLTKCVQSRQHKTLKALRNRMLEHARATPSNGVRIA